MPTHKKIFQNLIKNNALAHSYLFFGEDKNALLEFADWLSDILEGQMPLIDMMKTGSGIDDIREGIKFLWQKPFKSPKKTLIIPDGENLTDEAQNAILKISEDPPEHTLIILIVKNPEVLLPTLRSRFQKIYFSNQCEKSESNANDAKKDSHVPFAKAFAYEFLKSSVAKRKEIIKQVIEDETELKNFVKGLILELNRDKLKNWKAIKELLGRWSVMSQYNTNKKLQLEGWIKHLL